MARTRRNAMLIEEARQKIRTSQLLNRLSDHVFGKCNMSSTQVKAALGLLAKTIPDLMAHKHDIEATVTTYVVAAPAIAPDAITWQQQLPTLQ